MPNRKRLIHTVPDWVKPGCWFFITIAAQQRGVNTLALPDVATNILKAVRFYHNQSKWWVHEWVVMPDHVHAIVAIGDVNLNALVIAWKRYTSKAAGIVWQRGFFDHRLRAGETADAKARYVQMNPVRAGLVVKPEDWPYRWVNQER